MLRFPALLHVRLEDPEFSIYGAVVQESCVFLSDMLGIHGLRLGKDPDNSRSVD